MTQRRNLGGARREATERVVLLDAGRELTAWALNISRGGLRIITEETIQVGAEMEVVIGEGEARPVRVVWVRDEPDGQIVGLEFLDGTQESSRPPPVA